MIDLTTPKRPKLEEVVNVDDEIEFVGVRQHHPPPAAEVAHRPKRICAFGVRCNRMTDREHLLNFSHADNEIRPLPTLALPVNMFGGALAQQSYLLARQRELERQEQQLVAALAQSIREQNEADERQRVREQQDAEYQKGLARDKKAAASKRQTSVETILVDEEQKDEDRKKADEELSVTVAESKRPRLVEELRPEPDADDPNAVSVTLQLLDGSRQTRRFQGGDKAVQIHVFASTLHPKESSLMLVRLPEGKVDPDQLVSSFGKRVLLFVKLDE